MAASSHLLSLTPKTLSLHQYSTAASSALFSPCLLKPLPKLSLSLSLFSIKNQTHSVPRFIPKVSVSSELDSDLGEEEEEEAEEEEELEFADGPSRYSEARKRFPEEQKVFVGNLPWNTGCDYLAALFGQLGVVEEVDIVHDKNTGRSRGFAFVVMSTPEEAKAAAQQLDGYELDGRSLKVKHGPPPPKSESSSFGGPRGGRGGGERRYGDDTSSFRGPRGGGERRYGDDTSSFRGGPRGGGGERRYGDDTSSFRGGPRRGGGGGGERRNSDDTNKLYVGNLSWDIDNSDLESMFRKQGQVTEARVVTDRESGQSKGFGFVTFSSRDEANNAIEAMDGAEFEGRNIRVNLAEARPPRSF